RGLVAATGATRGAVADGRVHGRGVPAVRCGRPERGARAPAARPAARAHLLPAIAAAPEPHARGRTGARIAATRTPSQPPSRGGAARGAAAARARRLLDLVVRARRRHRLLLQP